MSEERLTAREWSERCVAELQRMTAVSAQRSGLPFSGALVDLNDVLRIVRGERFHTVFDRPADPRWFPKE